MGTLGLWPAELITLYGSRGSAENFSRSSCVGASKGRESLHLPMLPRPLELLPVQKPVNKNQ